jgi:hypothetical protein
VSEHKLAYLRARWATFVMVIGLTRSPTTTVLRHGEQIHDRLLDAGVGTRAAPLQIALTAALRSIGTTLLIFRPIFYLALALVLVVIARRQRDVLALLLSGLAMESSLFFLAPSIDYRYSHWMVTCACASLAIVVARRWASRRGAE